MRLLRTLVPSLAVLSLAAGEAATPAPAVLRLADGAQLEQAWDASIYAKVWADPALEPLRAQWAEARKEMQTEAGFDVIAAVLGMRGFEAKFLGLAGKDKPMFHARVDLGAVAGPLFAAIAKEGKGEAKQVAGADEAFGDDDATLARFGTVLVAFANCQPQPAGPNVPAPAAVAVDVDVKKVLDAVAPHVPEHEKADFDRVVQNLTSLLGLWTYRGDLVPEGIRERLDGSVAAPGAQAVDRALLARLPATTLMVAAYGFDGKGYWQAMGPGLLANLDQAMHPGMPVGPEQTAQQIQGLLAAMGVNASMQQLIEGLSGTSLIAITQSAPFPAITLALPRSPGLDQLLGMGLAQIGGALPEEGQSAPVQIPGAMIPVPITLLRDKTHWVLTTDVMLAANWSSGSPGGFADSAMAKELYAKAPADACLLGASDTPAVLRTIQGFLGLGLASADLTPEQKNAINTALIRLAASASTGYIFSANDAKGSHSEVRGLIGAGVLPMVAIGAGVAAVQAQQRQAFAMEDDATPEGKAMTVLGGSLFPAQIQFQAASYVDQDGDGTGEYGTFAELTGAVAAPGRAEAEAIAQGFAADGTRDGFRYAVHLPDAAGKALVDQGKARPALKAAADAQERAFVIYAWPLKAEAGARMFAVDQTGVVYEAPFAGKAPAWNELYGGQGWDGIPAWQPAQR